jgi:hypothetical protein
MASYFKAALNKQKRTRQRVELVGSGGVNKQDTRRRKVKASGGNMAKDTVRRVGEYKAGKVSSEADYHSKEGKKGYKK